MRRSLMLLAAAAALAPRIVSAQDKRPATRVVVQVSEADPTRWMLALNNVQNLQEGLGAANVDVEIVAYGPGIGMLRGDSSVRARITQALHAGIAVVACENTMRNQKLTPADMHPEVGYVPAGVIEIVERQQQGWAYLRP